MAVRDRQVQRARSSASAPRRPKTWTIEVGVKLKAYLESTSMSPSGDTSTTSPVANPHTTNEPFGVHPTAPIPGAATAAAPASAAARVSPTASFAVRRRPSTDHFRR